MRILLTGYLAGDLYEPLKHGKRRTVSWLNEDVVCHCLDIYQRHAIEKAHHARAVCSAHLPEGPWDEIRYLTGPKRMSGELQLDLLQEIHLLKPARWTLDYRGREADRQALLDKIRKQPDRVRDFSARWTASVPSGPVREFVSFPGCFCHRRQDAGGLALAEILVREGVSGRLLDMGCGSGLVGLLAASVRPVELTMVDSSARAVEAATLNARNHQVAAEVILSDTGTPKRLDGSFDVFAGNPPYYSDYRIAEIFLETAQRALKPGGACYTVCKNAAGLEPVQRKYFPSVEIIPRRGYAVLKSVKPNSPGDTAP